MWTLSEKKPENFVPVESYSLHDHSVVGVGIDYIIELEHPRQKKSREFLGLVVFNIESRKGVSKLPTALSYHVVSESEAELVFQNYWPSVFQEKNRSSKTRISSFKMI